MGWTPQTLTDFLNRKSIPHHSYSFYKDKDDAFCLDEKNGEWMVYYSERGCKHVLGWAKSESLALNLLKLFLLDAYGHI